MRYGAECARVDDAIEYGGLIRGLVRGLVRVLVRGLVRGLGETLY